MELYTNSSYRKDYFRFALEDYGKNTKVNIASAFFDNSELIKSFIKNGCIVNLIIRLGEGTSETRLKEIINLPNLSIRYFTSTNFHPKFYIFEKKLAFIGSSNLTNNGGTSNREVNVSIEYDSEVYNFLREDFGYYWANATVLDEKTLDKYISFVKENGEDRKAIDNNKKEFNKIFSDDSEKLFTVSIDKTLRKNAINDYMEISKKEYQEFINQFRILEKIYIKTGKRKVSEEILPLRLEIHQFFNWIRDRHCKGNSFQNSVKREMSDLEKFSKENIEEFIEDDYKEFDDIIDNRFPIINSFFSDKLKIENASEQELKNVLSWIYSFHSRHRFFSGGFETLWNTFTTKNEIERIKKSLIYIFYGPEDFITRVAKFQLDEEYKLMEIGESCSKELFGWVNKENIPIYNKRTYIGMKWLGFDI